MTQKSLGNIMKNAQSYSKNKKVETIVNTSFKIYYFLFFIVYLNILSKKYTNSANSAISKIHFFINSSIGLLLFFRFQPFGSSTNLTFFSKRIILTSAIIILTNVFYSFLKKKLSSTIFFLLFLQFSLGIILLNIFSKKIINDFERRILFLSSRSVLYMTLYKEDEEIHQ